METRDLILDKARFEDWEDMYRNVWSRPEPAQYMLWQVTASEEEAKARMERTIAWQIARERGGTEFRCSVRAENAASKALIAACGFTLTATGSCIDQRNNRAYTLELYARQLYGQAPCP